MSSWNHSVLSAVVTIQSALVLYHISGMYCRQVINNLSLTPRMASAVAGGMLYRSPLLRDRDPYTAVRYIPLDAQ